jgi:uncharacterized protein (DUF1499 family)
MSKTSDRRPSFFSRFGLLFAVIAILIAAVAGSGTRWGAWDFRVGFRLLSWGSYVGIAALALSLVGLVLTRPGKARRGFLRALFGFLISLGLLGYLGKWLWVARTVPAIHDISTDTENPPRFVAILPLREDAPNPADYGGPEIAEKQRKGYPDLHPLLLKVAPDRAFERALAAAREMGWIVVQADPLSGRIEATDTTLWFGFKDDIVVRVASAGNGSRIDVRSVSRVGRSDVGTNAKRIKAYLRKMSSY